MVEQTPSRPLTGMKEIAAYAKRSESIILQWIRERGFPAVKIGGSGTWESNTGMIDEWKAGQILTGLRQSKPPMSAQAPRPPKRPRTERPDRW